ncbi:hypothetical protein [Streptomyces sp. NPDC016845]|uniref:hypothetical protein n=1 Tax=Streptomyces sp. NPDC016845 TaxID=3364972 RepID=UPI0037891755
MVTIDVAVILAIVAILLLRRPVAPRKRGDTVLVMLILLVLGVLIAPTALGQAITDMMGELSDALTSIGD